MTQKTKLILRKIRAKSTLKITFKDIILMNKLRKMNPETLTVEKGFFDFFWFYSKVSVYELNFPKGLYIKENLPRHPGRYSIFNAKNIHIGAIRPVCKKT